MSSVFLDYFSSDQDYLTMPDYWAQLQDLSKSFPFHIDTVTSRDEPFFPRHDHPFIEMMIIQSGSVDLILEEQSIPLRRGDVFVIPTGSPHGFRDLRSFVRTILFFTPEIIKELCKGLTAMPEYHSLFSHNHYEVRHGNLKSIMRLGAGQLQDVKVILNQMCEEYNRKQPGYRTAFKGLFCQLATYLCRCYSFSGGPRSTLPVADAAAYLSQNFKERITLDDLSRRSGLSVTHFSRLFQEIYKTSPIDYLINLRVEHACDLLENSKMPVTEIAFECGFSDSNYFSRIFRRQIGQSPSSYRKQHFQRKEKMNMTY